MASKSIPVHIAYTQHSSWSPRNQKQLMNHEKTTSSSVRCLSHLLTTWNFLKRPWVSGNIISHTNIKWQAFCPAKSTIKKDNLPTTTFHHIFGASMVPILVTLLDQIKRRQNFVVTYNASPSSVESTESSNLVLTLGAVPQQERFHSNISVTHKAVPAATTQRIDQVDTSGTSWHASWMLPALGAGLPLAGKMPWHCLGTDGHSGLA